MVNHEQKTITVFPHIVSSETETILFEFGNLNVTVHRAKGHST